MAEITIGERADAVRATLARAPSHFAKFLVANMVQYNQALTNSDQEIRANAMSDGTPPFALESQLFINFCVQRIVGNVILAAVDVPLSLGATAYTIGMAAVTGKPIE